MGWRRATKRKRNPQRPRVSEKFESRHGEFAKALDQHVHDFKREVEAELPDSTLQAISVACLLLSPVRGK